MILEGEGVLPGEKRSCPVKTGDLVVNPFDGTHGLANTGTRAPKILVFSGDSAAKPASA